MVNEMYISYINKMLVRLIKNNAYTMHTLFFIRNSLRFGQFLTLFRTSLRFFCHLSPVSYKTRVILKPSTDNICSYTGYTNVYTNSKPENEN